MRYRGAMAAPDRDGARAVPVYAERGAQRRVMGATDWWFYPLIVLAAAALMAVSLGGEAFVRDARPQAARLEGGILVFGPRALAQGTQTDPTHVSYVVRDLGVRIRAVRLAIRPNAPPPTAGDTAAALLLAPAQTQALVGRPVRAELAYRRFSITAAGAVALRFDDGPWTIAPLPPQSGPVVVVLPAPTRAPARLGIRLISDQTDMNYGAEFRRIVLRPES